ncbi:MAG: FGGY family carbohydrate kinase, partial [Spirochaetia bacterium]
MAKSTGYDPATVISEGRAVLGVEFGSTRIKATLIGPDHRPIAAGAHNWENQLTDGIWTYPLDEAWNGLASAFADLSSDVKKQYGATLSSIAAAGFSGMMHGYVALDADDNLLVPFRTWRNNITGEAAATLSRLFHFPIA